MDIGYTYSTRQRLLAYVYAPPEVVPPDAFTMTVDGQDVEFLRLSDRSLACEDVAGVPGHCGSFECHRRVLGECQCGRHGRGPEGQKVPVSFRLAESGGGR